MPFFMRILSAALLVSAGTAGVLASPGTVPPTFNPMKLDKTAGGLQTRSSSSLNPMDKPAHSLDMAHSNAQRMARGLPPNKPNFRRADRPARPRPSQAAPKPQPTGGACAPRNGIIHVTTPDNAPTDRNGPRPHLDGYLSSHANEFGEYIYTAERRDALKVTINDCEGAPFDILASNGFRDFPFVGGIKGFASGSANLDDGSFNYVYIGGVTQTAPRVTPQDVPNSFTAATEVSEVSESAIWSFQSGSYGVLKAQWVNTDALSPRNSLVYIPSIGVFVLTGDVRRFEEIFENVSEATFTFEAV